MDWRFRSHSRAHPTPAFKRYRSALRINPKSRAACHLFPQVRRIDILDIAFPVWEPNGVRVISRRAIRAFAERRPEALEPLRHWANAIEAVEWRNPGDVRRTFNTADFVGDLTVFDVGGNKYRVIAFVHYRRKAVYIKDVLTHKEYDKGVWKR